MPDEEWKLGLHHCISPQVQGNLRSSSLDEYSDVSTKSTTVCACDSHTHTNYVGGSQNKSLHIISKIESFVSSQDTYN